MPREQMPLRPVRVDYKCDKCGAGYMRPTGVLLTSNPPQFPHRCNNCDAHQNFTEKYPTVRYAAETQPMDCLTAGDVREAADEIERLRAEVANLREGLRWYAEGSHFMMAVQDAWDTVSGEPQNWWGDEAGTAMVEDGWHAKLVLAGELTGAQLHAPED